MLGSRVCQLAGILPVLLGDGVDVGGEREGDDVGVEAVDHRARLRAGAAVRGLDAQRLAGFGLPIGGEGLIDRLVELARRIVGDIEQGGLSLRRRAGADQKERRQGENLELLEALAPRGDVHVRLLLAMVHRSIYGWPGDSHPLS